MVPVGGQRPTDSALGHELSSLLYGEAFAPGCPASLAPDEVFFRKLFRDVNHDSDPARFCIHLLSESVIHMARNLDSAFIGMPDSHGSESALRERSSTGRFCSESLRKRVESLPETSDLPELPKQR